MSGSSILRIIIAMAIIAGAIFGIHRCSKSLEEKQAKEREWNHRQVTYPIMSVGSKDELHGSFFLGCGSIEGREYYVFFISTANGMVKKRTLVDNCYIQETNNVTPCFTVIQNEFSNEVVEKWENDYYAGCFYRKLYVPVGTVIKKYTIN